MTGRFLAELALFAAVTFPTDDGHTLRFDPALGDVVYHFALDFEVRDSEPMMPKDILRFTVWIADADGEVWEGRSVFTAEQFVPLFLDAGYTSPLLTVESDTLPDHLSALCDGPRLDDARTAWDDDGGGRHSLTVGDETFPLMLKYAVVGFDVAPVLRDGPSGGLAIRLNGLVTEEGELVPPLYTWVLLDNVWGWNGAAFDQDDEFWYDSLLPVPIVFRRTGESGPAQASVVASGTP